MKWYISFTRGLTEWVAWASETQPPRDADIATMLGYPGEVHFAHGKTIEEARARLEAGLPREAVQDSI